MSEPFAIPLFCPHCGGALEVQTTDWQSDEPIVEQAWICPYCGAENLGGLSGRVAWVTHAANQS
jgi:hypothetical protein